MWISGGSQRELFSHFLSCPTPIHTALDLRGTESLIFFSLLFLNRHGKPAKKARIFLPSEPLKIPGKEGKSHQKSKEFLAKEKSKEIQKARKKKIRDQEPRMARVPEFGARKSIPKNSSSQAFGELEVNFLAWILTKTLDFVTKRPSLFAKFLGRLRMNFAIGRLFRSPTEWRAWNRKIRVSWFWVARFSIQDRRLSATQLWMVSLGP